MFRIRFCIFYNRSELTHCPRSQPCKLFQCVLNNLHTRLNDISQQLGLTGAGVQSIHDAIQQLGLPAVGAVNMPAINQAQASEASFSQALQGPNSSLNYLGKHVKL